MSGRRISEPKGFQLAIVQAALATLTGEEGPRRFLVADEVGLGKTVVARTIIQEMIKRHRRPVVVFYVSSNLNIAHQNRAKLLELLPTEAEQKAATAAADRLTLAANPRYRPTHEKLHLYTLTPDTSVPQYRRRGGFGRMEERALILRLLKGRFPSLDTPWFSAKCRGNQARESSWKWALEQHEDIKAVRELQDHFVDALSHDKNFSTVDASSLSQAAENPRPSHFMGMLRTALALAVLRDVQPDIVIFDEFQKFRKLLIDPRNVSPDPVTQALRGGVRGRGHAVLLLSATPYRLYSSRQEEAAGASHHQDFFELIRFLFGNETKEPKEIERAFLDFGARMLAKETPDFEQLGMLRDELQKRLRPVLSRTERPSDAAPVNASHPPSEIRPEDLRIFKHWTARLQESQPARGGKVDLVSFAVPYWLSVPMPIQMMGSGYVAWRRAEKKRKRREEPTFREAQRNRLEAPKVWPHPQLRALNNIAPPSRLALPWVSPSLPWWDLEGPWAEPSAAGGKLLIFTRFKAVPPALASLLSFNLEASFAHRLRRDYKRAGEAQPLQLKEDRPTLPALFFPSPTLIAYTDPRRDRPSDLAEVQNSMRRQIGQFLREKLGTEVKKSGGRRPLWKLLPALEQARADLLPDSGLPSWREIRNHWHGIAGGQAEVMRQVIGKWNDFADTGLASVTQSEVAALAEFALSGPGVVLGRALYRFDQSCIANENYGRLLNASWHGLRSYLNRSLFQAVLTRRGQRYTHAIPEAVVAGNLESVLDEHLWIAGKLDADAITRFSRDLVKTLGLHEGRYRLHEPGRGEDGFVLRCHAAMPFADAKVENTSTGGEERLRTDDMRRSFNTPFWPHVLATTSLGQEGLDFHVWCRQLLHWDLCPSPLDLEQREGRIQRFGGLSVRCALADQLRQRSLTGGDWTSSPWTVLANHAEDEFSSDLSGRSPWWTCPGEKIDRLFVVLPQSRQTARFDQLSRLRWLYRLALGQPHQQDFIETVSQLPNDGRQGFALSLSAWPHFARDGMCLVTIQNAPGAVHTQEFADIGTSGPNFSVALNGQTRGTSS
jgi:hypothetical protein